MACFVNQFDLANPNLNLGSSNDDKRRNLVSLARTAEAAERYDDMCKCMKKLVLITSGANDDLTVDERNLLSVAYKNVIGGRRASWRTLNAEHQDEKSSRLISKYKDHVEAELSAICQDILGLLEDKLIKESTIADITGGNEDIGDTKPEVKANSEGEAQVFYLKMSGDYWRYLAEAIPDKDDPDKNAAKFYKRAFAVSQYVLEPTHPIRLGLALNYSVCFYEILKEKKKACELAKDAFDDAIAKLDKLNEADYKDSTLIMQLLRDNLTLWTSSEDQDQEDLPEDNVGGD